MPTVTKSIHPLPFEHLEPKRFEDLVRQLIYDFRNWRQLEATGRGGADDGFDARGYEIGDATDSVPSDEDDESIALPVSNDRLWLVQCKREKTIGPSKLNAYLEAIPLESKKDLHGIIFVAACTFSKKAHDIFRSWCAQNSLQEFHLWGASEIEDLLYLPKNDHLLFAYFGISLQIRKQKVATTIRRLVSLKRKLNRHIPVEDRFGNPIILRDPSDDRYPFTNGKALSEGKFLWLPTYSKGISAQGLQIVIRRHWAYYNYEFGYWDFASGVKLDIPSKRENPWYSRQVPDEYEQKLDALREFWLTLPRGGQFHFLLVYCISYDDILDIDEVGDNVLKIPTVFVAFQNGAAPLSPHGRVVLTSGSSHAPNVPFNPKGHVRVFPDMFRDIKWEIDWFGRNKIPYATERFVVPPPNVPESTSEA
jgi:restriction endonuclease